MIPTSEDALPAEAIEAAAVRLLAMREHSRAELERKLATRFGPLTAVSRVLDDLQARGLVSDARFAEAYVDQRSRKGFGPLRLRAELGERGIAGAEVARWLDSADIDWDRLLFETAGRRFGSGPASDRRDLAKRARFLQQRGFPQGLIGRYLDTVRHD